MKLFNLLQFKPSEKEFHTAPEHKHDQADGCEFLDETVHLHDEPVDDTELG